MFMENGLYLLFTIKQSIAINYVLSPVHSPNVRVMSTIGSSKSLQTWVKKSKSFDESKGLFCEVL